MCHEGVSLYQTCVREICLCKPPVELDDAPKGASRHNVVYRWLEAVEAFEPAQLAVPDPTPGDVLRERRMKEEAVTPPR